MKRAVFCTVAERVARPMKGEETERSLLDTEISGKGETARVEVAMVVNEVFAVVC